ncbi:MAG: hypothetical protein J5J06_01840 [Phycisphaerae bacterium]|nr:hypothetical protein [Phycisphaerae bacterium]
MRIAYGIHGYGRGHAMRARAVLPHLAARHELLILAGGNAYEALWPDFSPVRIPTLQHRYTVGGELSPYLTVTRNAPAVFDFWLHGPATDMVQDILRDFRADVVISDSEALTLWAARRMGVPRISFDHFGLLVHCRLDLSPMDRLRCRTNAAAYRMLFGTSERVIVSSFFTAPARRPGVCVVGPVIRTEVRQTEPTRGDYLLVYLSTGSAEFTPRVEKALLGLDVPVKVYGTPRRGLQGNIQFKPLANLPFIEDLAGCRAVFATTGNQLMGEVLYFGKPILGMPINCIEQRLNAHQIDKLGIGRQVKRRHVSATVIREFLADEEKFLRNVKRDRRDGELEALEAIECFAGELCAARPADVRNTPS